MRIVPDRTTLVIAGAWNQAIFTPQFVAQKIMPGPEAVRSDIELGPGGFTVHHSGGSLRLSVRPDRLIWRPHNTDDGTLRVLEEAARSLLSLLSVTPVSALGFNLGFEAAGTEGNLARMLELPDSPKLDELGITSESVSVRRKLRLDGQELNTVMARAGNDPVHIDLNFHRDVEGAEGAMEGLRGAMTKFKQQALELLRTLYKLELT
jgi:hypothetical protein